MIARAKVEKTYGNTADVCVIKKSACGACDTCSAKGACHAEIILSDAHKTYTCSVKNEIGAKKGDIVELYSDDKLSLAFAFITFILPVILTVAGYYIINNFFGETQSIIASVIIFCISFFSCAFISNKLSKKYSETRIRKIIKESSEKLF